MVPQAGQRGVGGGPAGGGARTDPQPRQLPDPSWLAFPHEAQMIVVLGLSAGVPVLFTGKRGKLACRGDARHR